MSFCPPQVTLLQAVRTPLRAENFSFLLDELVSNVTLYITGSSPAFTLYSPTGLRGDHHPCLCTY